MTRRRSTIIPRRPIFLGCEGESEQGYGQLLNDLLRDDDIPVHLEVVNLNPGAGDPLTRLRRAEQEIARRQQRRTAFAGTAILMDSDQIEADAQRRRDVEHLAQRLGIRIIWQQPCHEAFLLRHLDGFGQHRPLTANAADAALRSAWPLYRKPMTKLLLGRRIGLAEVQRAALVEVALAAFLHDIGLLP